MKFVVYYKLFGGPDGSIKYANAEVMRADVSFNGDKFMYLKVYKIVEGEEVIVYNSYNELMNE